MHAPGCSLVGKAKGVRRFTNDDGQFVLNLGLSELHVVSISTPSDTSGGFVELVDASGMHSIAPDC